MREIELKPLSDVPSKAQLAACGLCRVLWSGEPGLTQMERIAELGGGSVTAGFKLIDAVLDWDDALHRGDDYAFLTQAGRVLELLPPEVAEELRKHPGPAVLALLDTGRRILYGDEALSEDEVARGRGLGPRGPGSPALQVKPVPSGRNLPEGEPALIGDGMDVALGPEGGE
jgi:hypothetical protein